MSSDKENQTIPTNDLCSLGEKLLSSFIKKGRDSVISKNDIGTDALQNENEYPAFFKMLDTDVSKCDEKWIEDFNQATNNATDDDFKKYGKTAIDMLSSIIYFLITKYKSEKKQENNQDDSSTKSDHTDQTESKRDDAKNYYFYDEEFDNDEILRELTEGLDPKYIDPDFNMIHSATIQKNNFDTYSLYGNESKIYKTQENMH